MIVKTGFCLSNRFTNGSLKGIGGSGGLIWWRMGLESRRTDGPKQKKKKNLYPYVNMITTRIDQVKLWL